MASQASGSNIRRKSKATEGEGHVGVQSLLSELGAKLQSIQVASSGRSSLTDGASRQESLTTGAAGDVWPAAGGEALVRSRRTTRLIQAASDAASTLPPTQPNRSISRRSTAHDFSATAPGRVATPGLVSRRVSQLDFGASAATTGTARTGNSPSIGYGASLSRRTTAELQGPGAGHLSRSRRTTGEVVAGAGLGPDLSGVSLESLSSRLPPPATSWSRRTSSVLGGASAGADTFMFTGKAHPLAGPRNQLLAADPTPDTPVFMGGKARPAPWELPGDGHAEGGGGAQEGHSGAAGGGGHGPSRLGGTLSRRATSNAFEAAGGRSISPFLSGASSTSSPDVPQGPTPSRPGTAPPGGGQAPDSSSSSPSGVSPNMMLVKSALQDLATRMQQLPMSPLEQVLWQQRQQHLQLLGRAMGALGGLSVDVDVLLQRCAMSDLEAAMLTDAANVSDQQGPPGEGGSSSGNNTRSSGGGTAPGRTSPSPTTAPAAAGSEPGRPGGSPGIGSAQPGTSLLSRQLSSSPLGRPLSTSRLSRQHSGTSRGLDSLVLGASLPAAAAAAAAGGGGRSRDVSPTSPRRTRTSTNSLPVISVAGPAATAVVSPFLQHQQEEVGEQSGTRTDQQQQQQQQQQQPPSGMQDQQAGLRRAGSFGFGGLQAATSSPAEPNVESRPGSDKPPITVLQRARSSQQLGRASQQASGGFESDMLAAEDAAPGRRLSERGQLLHDLKYGLVELVEVVQEASGLASHHSSSNNSSRAASGSSVQGGMAGEGSGLADGVDGGHSATAEEEAAAEQQPTRSSSSSSRGPTVQHASPMDLEQLQEHEQQEQLDGRPLQLSLDAGSMELAAAAVEPVAASEAAGQATLPRPRPMFKIPAMDLANDEQQGGEQEASEEVSTPVFLLGGTGAGDALGDTSMPRLALSRQASKQPSGRLKLKLQEQEQQEGQESEDDFEAEMRKEEAAARAAAGLPEARSSEYSSDDNQASLEEAGGLEQQQQQQQQQHRLSSSSADFEAALRRQEAAAGEAAPQATATEESEEDFEAGLRRQEAEARAGHPSDAGAGSDDDFEAALRQQEQEAAAAAGVQLGDGGREGSDDFEAAMRRQELEARGGRLSDSGSDDFEAAMRRQEQEAAAAAGGRKRSSSNAGSGGGYEAEPQGEGGAGPGVQAAVSSSSSEDFEAALRKRGEAAGAGARKRTPEWEEGEGGEEEQDEEEDFEAALKRQEAEARGGRVSDGSDDFEAALRRQEEEAAAGRPPSSSSSDDFEAAMRKQEANARGDRPHAEPECYWEGSGSDAGHSSSSAGGAPPPQQAAATAGAGWEGPLVAPAPAPVGGMEGEGGGNFNIPQLNLGRVGSIGDMQGLALSPKASALVGMGSYSPSGWAAQQQQQQADPWDQQQEGEEEDGAGLQVEASLSSSDTPPPPARPPAAAGPRAPAAAANKQAPPAPAAAKSSAFGSGSAVVGSIVRNRAGGLNPAVAAALAAGIEAVKQEQAAAAAAAAAVAAQAVPAASDAAAPIAGSPPGAPSGTAAAGSTARPELRRTYSPEQRLSDTSDASDPITAPGEAPGAQQQLGAAGGPPQQQQQQQQAMVGAAAAAGPDAQEGGAAGAKMGPGAGRQQSLRQAAISSAASSRQPSLQQAFRMSPPPEGAVSGPGATRGPDRLPSQGLHRTSTSTRKRGQAEQSSGRHPAALSASDARHADEDEAVVSGSDTADVEEASAIIAGSASEAEDVASWQGAPTPSDGAGSECGQSDGSPAQQEEEEEEAGFGSQQASGPAAAAAGGESADEDACQLEDGSSQQQARYLEPQQQQQQQQQQQRHTARKQAGGLQQQHPRQQQQQQQQQPQQQQQRRSPARGPTASPAPPPADLDASWHPHPQQQQQQQQQQQLPPQQAVLGTYETGLGQHLPYGTFHSGGSMAGPRFAAGAAEAAAAEQQLGHVLQLLAHAQALAARSDALKQQQQRVASSAMSAAGEAVVGVWSALTGDASLTSAGGSVTSITSEGTAHQQQQLEMAAVLSDAAETYGKQAAAARLQAVSLLQQAVAALALLPGAEAGGLNLQGLLPAAEAMLQQQEAAVAAAAVQSIGAMPIAIRPISRGKHGAAASPGPAAPTSQQQQPQGHVGVATAVVPGALGGVTSVTRATSPTPLAATTAAAAAPGGGGMASSLAPAAEGATSMAPAAGNSMGSAAATGTFGQGVSDTHVQCHAHAEQQQQQQQQQMGSSLAPAACAGSATTAAGHSPHTYLGHTAAHIASATAAAATAAACHAVRQVPGSWAPAVAVAAGNGGPGAWSGAGDAAPGGLGVAAPLESPSGHAQATPGVWLSATSAVPATAAAEAFLGSPSQVQALLDAQAHAAAAAATVGSAPYAPGPTKVAQVKAGPPSLAQQLAAAEAALQALERRAAKGASQEQLLGKTVKKHLQHLQKPVPLTSAVDVQWEAAAADPLPPPPLLIQGGSCFVSPQLRERSMYGSSRRQMPMGSSGIPPPAAHLSPAAAGAVDWDEPMGANPWELPPVYGSGMDDWSRSEAAATWQAARPLSSSRRHSPQVSRYTYAPADAYADSSYLPGGLGGYSNSSSRWGQPSGMGLVRTAAPVITEPCRTCGSPVPMTAQPVAPVSPGGVTRGTWTTGQAAVPSGPRLPHWVPSTPPAAAAMSAADPCSTYSRGRPTTAGVRPHPGTASASAAAAAAGPTGADAATLHLLRTSLEAVKLERLQLQAEQPLMAARTRQAAEEARVLSCVLTDYLGAPDASWQ